MLPLRGAQLLHTLGTEPLDDRIVVVVHTLLHGMEVPVRFLHRRATSTRRTPIGHLPQHGDRRQILWPQLSPLRHLLQQILLAEVWGVPGAAAVGVPGIFILSTETRAPPTPVVVVAFGPTAAAPGLPITIASVVRPPLVLAAAALSRVELLLERPSSDPVCEELSELRPRWVELPNIESKEPS